MTSVGDRLRRLDERVGVHGYRPPVDAAHAARRARNAQRRVVVAGVLMVAFAVAAILLRDFTIAVEEPPLLGLLLLTWGDRQRARSYVPPESGD